MACDVFDEVILLSRLAAQDFPQQARLEEILVRYGELLGHGGTSPLLVLLRGLDWLVGHVAVGRGVIGVGTVVAVDGHDAVALIGVEGAERLIDGDLLVIDTEAVAVGVRVGEETGLEDWVGRRFNARNHVRGREGHLLDFGKIILGVSIEGEFAKGPQWNFFLRPDFGKVEDIPVEFLGLFRAEDLEVASPGWVVSVLNRVK